MTTPPPSKGPQLTDEERAFLEADTQTLPAIRGAAPPPQLAWEAMLAGGAAATVIAAMLVLYLAQQPVAPDHGTQGSAPNAQPDASVNATGGEVEDGRGRPAAPPVPAPVPVPPVASAPALPGSPAPTSSEEAEAEAARGCVTVTYRTPGGPADCRPAAEVCELGSPWHTLHGEAVCGGPVPTQHVRVTSLPTPGGSANEFHCLAWTDSGSGVFRTAELLVDAPAEQCGAHLVRADGLAFRPDGPSVFSDVPQRCVSMYPGTRLTYPGILEATNDTAASAPLHVCVSADTAA
ncbi:hypothetical protein [Streptomyces spiramenti]|uniref:Uncharacterized protein n=1 Tax=Streptomyces spiramenti TaxID=2720606 RepID=A0ABX1AH18_9ACTN|nr:hypothetical protein [Streptomyces spiramenti]NJP66443.1 hypothetical protein [Streptomyces spiramenti]